MLFPNLNKQKTEKQDVVEAKSLPDSLIKFQIL